jgi:hypothetical protein
MRFFFMHDKHKLCRAFLPWGTANFFPRRPLPPSPTVRPRFFGYLCRALGQGARQTSLGAHICLPCVFPRRTTNICVCQCFPTVHGKVFLKKLIFVLLFISPLQNIILYSIFQSYTCLDKFTIFNNYVSLKEFFSYGSNLNCKCIK